MFILILNLPYPKSSKQNGCLWRCTIFILWLQVSWSATRNPTEKHRTRWFLRPLVPARPRKGA